MRPARGERACQGDSILSRRSSQCKGPKGGTVPDVTMEQQGGLCFSHGRRWGESVARARPQGLVDDSEGFGFYSECACGHTQGRAPHYSHSENIL